MHIDSHKGRETGRSGEEETEELAEGKSFRMPTIKEQKANKRIRESAKFL
jgi:hypothetical protein